MLIVYLIFMGNPQNLIMKVGSSSSSIQQKTLKIDKFSKSLPNLLIPEDIEIKALQNAESGKTGAFFIQLNQGTFVLKATSQTPTALFFDRLAKILGISTPSMAYITYQRKQYNDIVNKITSYVRSQKHNTFAKIGNKFTHCFYQIIQYIPSITLPEIGPENFKKYLLTTNCLEEMGVCIAFDLIANNNDRFHLLWGGQGNIDNILVELTQQQQSEQSHPVRFVFIDNYGNFCNMNNKVVAQNTQKYFDKVREFFQQIHTFEQNNNIQEAKYLTRLCKQLEMFTTHFLTHQQLLVVIRAIKQKHREFIQLYETGKISSILEQLYAEHEKHNMSEFCMNQWKGDLSRINLNFCEAYYRTIKLIFQQ